MMLCVDGSDIESIFFALALREGDVLQVRCEQKVERRLGNELGLVQDFLAAQGVAVSDVDAVGLVVGPGSSGALRSTLSFMNAWALGRGMGVCEVVREGVGGPASGRMNGGWGVVRSEKAFVLPIYERAAHTTPSHKDALGRRIA